MTTAFSSAHMRERDKIIEERHKKELETADRRVQKYKRALEDADKQNFDLHNRVQQLASSLGFSDLNELQRAVDLSDHEVTFRQAFKRVEILESEIVLERTQKESLQVQCQELKELLDREQKRSAALEKTDERRQKELHDLNMQYDAAVDKGKRAQELFKIDRRKFFRLHEWLCLSTADQSKTAGQDIDYDKIRNQKTLRRKEILQEFGSRLSDLLGFDIPTLEQIMKEAQEEALAAQLESARDSPREEVHPSTSITKPPTTSRQPHTQRSSSPRPNVKSARCTKSPLPTHSSETEEDSQAPSQLFKQPHQPLPPSTLPNGPSSPTSSVTEPESQVSNHPVSSPGIPPASSPFSVRKPLSKKMYAKVSPKLPADRVICKDDIEFFEPLNWVKSGPKNATNLPDDEPPRKKPRLSLEFSVQTPNSTMASTSPSRRVFSTGRIVKDKKVWSDENTPLGKVVPTFRTSGQTRLEDYTIYKGRGRYSKEDYITTKTINAQYAINPERNAGVGHQFEEVVRNKDHRKCMDAGDCDECRGWYTAIGPMPKRAQGPIWRSPSTTPSKRCDRHTGTTTSSYAHDPDFSPSPSERHKKDIESHKKQVSRHRQNWTRPRTPPGYWNIGFPDTQETKEINQQAEEMHRKKLRDVEREAERGKWIRR